MPLACEGMGKVTTKVLPVITTDRRTGRNNEWQNSGVEGEHNDDGWMQA